MIHAAEDEHRPKDKRLNRIESILLQIVLEPASFTEEKYKLYCKYQIEIHNDPPTKLKEKGFRNFLVDSPLRPESPATADNVGYGSFHQNYLLDGRLVAVAVLDVLPKCVSSVYFMYDPDYAFLGLGKYSALREIALTKELGSKGCEDLKWYYMGFYIHTCQKMKYKGQYKPSGLLDPETYAWHSIDRCIPLLDRSKYVAFSRVLAAQGDAAAAHRARALLLQGGSMDENEDEAPPPGMLDPEEVTRDKLKEVFVLYKGLISPVVIAITNRCDALLLPRSDTEPSIPPYHDSDVRAETRGYYAALGPELARRMLLYINDPDSDE
ncbi:arginine-tRNA-protein transferase [Jimgerdemannia flammicorona]|uniref:Arginine-tRNA-protein transferase n=1 Tax=Jimgerdemannia flammicorona TaxID=994334 RepID=A0A433QPV6_9FUNG|nr:arginine-tRNA-protein transferase [Jimgerdemannia flammicorona]